jgi:hypothetical protein
MQLFISTLEKILNIAFYCKTESTGLLSAGLRETVKMRNYDLPHVDPVPRDRDEGHEHRQLESREVSKKINIFYIKNKVPSSMSCQFSFRQCCRTGTATFCLNGTETVIHSSRIRIQNKIEYKISKSQNSEKNERKRAASNIQQ